MELITHGFGAIADSWFHPADEMRPLVEAAIPQYAYSPQRAQQLLAESGWTRGPDAVLANQRTGERFEVEIRTSASGWSEKLLNAVGSDWRAVGTQVSLFEIPAPLRSDNEFRSKFSGVAEIQRRKDVLLTRAIHSLDAAGPENRWTGSNRGGYSNPRVDAVLNRLQATIDPAEQLDSHRAYLQEALADLALMPLYWEVEVVLAVKGIRGITGRDGWNFHEWDRE